MNASRCQRLVSAPWFQRMIVAVILLAGVLAGLETSPRLIEQFGSVLRALDWGVLAVFVAEAAIKIAAHGRQPWNYFRDGWNVFDFGIVLICCFPSESQFAAVLRLARALRLLRLVSALPKLQLLVGALLKSLGAMGYIGLLLTLTFYIYGVAGVHLFGKTDPEHFGSFGAALLSLLRVITLDNWSDLFQAAQASNPIAAVAYFMSFILMGTMIMLNLFIGIVMNSMSEMHAEIEARSGAGAQVQMPPGGFDDELSALGQQVDALKRRVERLRQIQATPAKSSPLSLPVTHLRSAAPPQMRTP